MTQSSKDKLQRCHDSFIARILAGIKTDLVLYLSLSNRELGEVLDELSSSINDVD